jgi:type I restriction enzyme M protein
MDITTLENWLWEAACSIRGPLDAPKYKDYILPLLFYKRLSDVYEDELQKLSQEFGDEDLASQLAQEDRALIRFYIPNGHTWPDVRKSPVKLGERLTEALREIAKENPKLVGVIDIVDFNATAAGQRILDDDTLAQLMGILNRQRLGLRDVEPDILGRAYEYLLRKFAEGSGQSAGEFYTPMEVATLMAFILDPEEGETIYDPACGSGGLLIKSQLRLRDKVAQRLGKDVHDFKAGDVQRPLQLFGQEINHVTYAMAKMNAFVHDMEAEIALGDTMKDPRLLALNQAPTPALPQLWGREQGRGEGAEGGVRAICVNLSGIGGNLLCETVEPAVRCIRPLKGPFASGGIQMTEIALRVLQQSFQGCSGPHDLTQVLIKADEQGGNHRRQDFACPPLSPGQV